MKKQVHIVLFFLCLMAVKSYAVNLPTSGAAPANACGNNITVYDNGGSAGNYTDNNDAYIVLNATGVASITISGTYNTESGYDGFILYDGAGTGGTVLNSWSGAGSMSYTGNCGQTLTIEFTSDYMVCNYAGIALNVTYSGSCTNYTNLVNVPSSGNNSIACGTNSILYDNGGSGSNYSNGVDGYTVINCAAPGQVSLCGIGNTENSYDYIYIYSGVGTGGTLLASYTGLGKNISYTGAVGQTLTVRFYSDGLVTESGFYINVTYLAMCCIPPTITGTTPGTRCGTGTVVLGATASAGTINWYAAPTGGVSLGTGTSFTTPSISSTTTYYVDATGSCTTASRTPVTATVVPAASVTTQPVATSVNSGLTAYFSVVATGASAYQWQYNGINVANGTPANAVYSGATTANLTINGAIAAGTYNAGGGYRCVVTGNAPCGTVNSNAAALTVNPAGYCTPDNFGTNCTGDFINEVQLNTLDNSSAGTGCTGGGTEFTYYTTPTTSLNRGSVYTCAIQEKGTTTGVNYGLAVWVDFNDNGSFADAGEFFLVGNAFPGNATTTFVRTVAIAVPATATIGATRMRVRFVRNVVLTSAMSCVSGGVSGETEDYLITITERVGNGYGVYSPDGSGVAGIRDCEIYALGGASGVGCRLCTPADAGYVSPLISTYPVITADNVSCTNTSMTISTAQAGATWVNEVQAGSGTFSAGTNVTAASVTGTYSAVDRKTIRLTTSKSIRQNIILESFESGGASIPPPTGWFTNAYPDGTHSAGVFNPHLGAVPLAGGGLWNAAYVFDYNTALGADAWLYTPGIAMTAGTQYWIGFWHAEFNGLWPERLEMKVGTAQTKAGQPTFIKDYSTAAHGTAWSYDKQPYTPGASGTNYFSFHCYSLPNEDWEQVDSVQVWKYSPTIDYTDFVNIMMGPPAPGAVLGVTNVCPGSYNFSASAVGTPGFQYHWTVNTVSGNTPTIATPDSSSTSIFFPNNTAGNLNYTVTLQVTSECCGNLAPINYAVLVYPQPATPTASAANPTPCPGSSVYLNATAPGNCTFNWYDAITGGNLLGTGPNFLVNPVVLGSTSYYVEAVDVHGCVSIPRQTVTVTGTAIPAPAVVNGSACGASNISLGISGATSGYIYNWYSGSCNGALQQSSAATVFIPYVTTTTQYYVSATAPGCLESNCSPVNATIGVPANPLIWLGAVAGANNWFNTANWTGGCLPTCADDVQIPKTAINPNIGYAGAVAACHSIILGSGGTPQPTLTFTDDKAELDVCGDFTQRGVLASTSTNHNEKVVFMGSSAQNYIKSSTASGNFINAVLNNSASLPLLAIKDSVGFQDFTVDSSFMFQNGVVTTEGGKKLVINNSYASSSLGGYGVGNSNYVYGRITRKIVGGRSYDFPVGGNPSTATSGQYPYELMNLNLNSFNATAHFITVSFENPVNYNGTGLPITEQGGQYSTVVDVGGINATTGYTAGRGGVWTVFTENNSNEIYSNPPADSTASYIMTLYGRNFNTVGFPTTGNHYSIVKRNTFCPGAWSLFSSVFQGSSVLGGTIIATRKTFSNFSQFAIVYNTDPSGLPVDLVTFDATCVDHSTLLTWATATENNNSYFTLERSCDENYFHYEPIATIPGAGNSSTLKEYSYTDHEAPGTCFYRLSQTDYSGMSTEFAPVSINCKENADFNFVGVLPNPADNEVNVLYTDAQKENVYLSITDMLGQPITTAKVLSDPGLNKITVDLTNYTAGVYFVKVYNDNKSFIKRVVKK